MTTFIIAICFILCVFVSFFVGAIFGGIAVLIKDNGIAHINKNDDKYYISFEFSNEHKIKPGQKYAIFQIKEDYKNERRI